MSDSEYGLQATLEARPETADELLAGEPQIQKVDVLAAKHSG